MKVNHFNGEPNWDYYMEVPAAFNFKIYNDTATQTAAVVKWEFATDDMYIHGDDFDKLKLSLEFIKSKYDLGEKYKLIVFTEDLDLLYHFIKNEFSCEVFNVGGKGIGICCIDDAIELREVKFIATEHWNEFTTSNKKIEALLEYAHYYFDNVIMWHKYKTKVHTDDLTAKLPLTIQEVIKNKISDNMTKTDKAFIESIYPERDEYLMAKKYLYIGGFCDTATKEKVSETIGHIDFKTSYVARMLTEKYPMSKFKKVDVSTLEQSLKNNCCIIKVRYTNFKVKRLGFLNKDKAYKFENIKTREYDAKIYSADSITFFLNELDFELVSQCYTYDTIEVLSLYVADKGQLPKYVRKVAEECYAAKETRSGVDKIWAKMCTEVIYGACAKGLYGIQDKAWKDFRDKAILSPYWGMWTASHARYALISFAILLGSDWLYSDTDSIFFKNPYLHVQLIEKYNEARRAIMYKYCAENGIDYNVFSELGTFTYEDGSNKDKFVISAFKSLGPKRYIFSIGKKIVPKIAGFKKQYKVGDELVNIWSKTFGNDETMYNEFKDNRKMRDIIKVTKILDKPYDLIYNGKVYHCKSGKFTGFIVSNISFEDVVNKAADMEAELKEIQKELGREQI